MFPTRWKVLPFAFCLLTFVFFLCSTSTIYAASDEEFSRITKDIEKVFGELERLRIQLKEREKENENLHATIMSMEGQIFSLKQQNKEEINNLKSELVDKLNSEDVRLKKELASSVQELKGHKESVPRREKELKSNLSSVESRLNSELRQKTEELNKLTSLNKEAASELKAAEERIEDIRNELTRRIRDTKEEYEAKLKAMDSHMNSQLEDREQAIAVAEKEIVQLKNEKGQLEKKFDAERKSRKSVKISKLSEENKSLQERMKDYEKELERREFNLTQVVSMKEAHINELNKEVENRRMNLAQVNEALKQAQGKNVTLQVELHNAQGRLKELAQSNDDMKQKLSAMEKSLLSKIYEQPSEKASEPQVKMAPKTPSAEQVVLKQENRALKSRVEFLEGALLRIGEGVGEETKLELNSDNVKSE